MFNAFRHDREESLRASREKQKEKLIAEALRRRRRNEEMRAASLNRVTSWASKHLDPQLTYVLQDGSVGLGHPDQHQFRGSSLDERVRRMYLTKTKAFPSSRDESSDSKRVTDEYTSPRNPEVDDRFDAFTLVLPAISEAKKDRWISKHDFNRFGREFGKDAPWKDPAHYETSGSPVGSVNISTTLRLRKKEEELGPDVLPTAKNAWERDILPVGSLRAEVSSKYLVKLSPLYEDKEYFKKRSEGHISAAELQLKMRDGKVYRKSLEAFLSHAYRKGGINSSKSLNEQLSLSRDATSRR